MTDNQSFKLEKLSLETVKVNFSFAKTNDIFFSKLISVISSKVH